MAIDPKTLKPITVDESGNPTEPAPVEVQPTAPAPAATPAPAETPAAYNWPNVARQRVAGSPVIPPEVSGQMGGWTKRGPAGELGPAKPEVNISYRDPSQRVDVVPTLRKLGVPWQNGDYLPPESWFDTNIPYSVNLGDGRVIQAANPQEYSALVYRLIRDKGAPDDPRIPKPTQNYTPDQIAADMESGDILMAHRKMLENVRAGNITEEQYEDFVNGKKTLWNLYEETGGQVGMVNNNPTSNKLQFISAQDYNEFANTRHAELTDSHLTYAEAHNQAVDLADYLHEVQANRQAEFQKLFKADINKYGLEKTVKGLDNTERSYYFPEFPGNFLDWETIPDEWQLKDSKGNPVLPATLPTMPRILGDKLKKAQLEQETFISKQLPAGYTAEINQGSWLNPAYIIHIKTPDGSYIQNDGSQVNAELFKQHFTPSEMAGYKTWAAANPETYKAWMRTLTQKNPALAAAIIEKTYNYPPEQTQAVVGALTAADPALDPLPAQVHQITTAPQTPDAQPDIIALSQGISMAPATGTEIPFSKGNEFLNGLVADTPGMFDEKKIVANFLQIPGIPDRAKLIALNLLTMGVPGIGLQTQLEMVDRAWNIGSSNAFTTLPYEAWGGKLNPDVSGGSAKDILPWLNPIYMLGGEEIVAAKNLIPRIAGMFLRGEERGAIEKVAKAGAEAAGVAAEVAMKDGEKLATNEIIKAIAPDEFTAPAQPVEIKPGDPFDPKAKYDVQDGVPVKVETPQYKKAGPGEPIEYVDPVAKTAYTRTDNKPPIAPAESGTPVMNPGEVLGNTTVAYDHKGQQYDFTYKLMDLDSLVTSHDVNLNENPVYLKDLQPRLRNREASEAQIKDIMKRFQPEMYLGESHTLTDGAQIIGPDNLVESGNGRTIALRRLKTQEPEKYQKYIDLLKSKADQYGFTPEQVDQLKDPVIVRLRNTEVNRPQFAEIANKRTTMAYSPIELAKSDTKLLPNDAIASLKVGEYSSIDEALLTQQNAKLMNEFLGAMDGNETAALKDAKGLPNLQAFSRLKSALFYNVYGDEGLNILARMTESMDTEGVKNIEKAMFASLGNVAKAEALITSGAKDAQYSIKDNIIAAVNFLIKARAEGVKPSMLADQIDLFAGETMPRTQAEMLKFFDTVKSFKKAKVFFDELSKGVMDAPLPGQEPMFGDKITIEDIIKNAGKEANLASPSSGSKAQGRLMEGANAGESKGAGGVGQEVRGGPPKDTGLPSGTPGSESVKPPEETPGAATYTPLNRVESMWAERGKKQPRNYPDAYLKLQEQLNDATYGLRRMQGQVEKNIPIEPGGAKDIRTLLTRSPGVANAGATRYMMTIDEIAKVAPDVVANDINTIVYANHAKEVLVEKGPERVMAGFFTDTTELDKVLADLETKLGPDKFAQAQKGAEIVKNTYQNELDRLVQSGLINGDLAKVLKEKYPWYNPLQYVEDAEKLALQGKSPKPYTVISSGLKRLTEEGTAKAAQSPLDVMANQLVKNEVRIHNNETAKAIIRVGLDDPQLAIKQLDKASWNKTGTMSFFEDGERQVYQVPDWMYRETNTIAKVINNPIASLIGSLNGISRAAFTSASPPFVVSNMLNDSVAAFVRGGILPHETGAALINSLKGLSKDPIMQSFRLSAGYQQRFYGKDLAKEVIKNGGGIIKPGKSILEKIWKFIPEAGEAGEQAPRMADFTKQLDKTLKGWRQMTPEQIAATPQGRAAAAHAVELTINFGRGGYLIKSANPFVIFLNASMEGVKLPFRSLAEVPAAKWRLAGMGAGLTGLAGYNLSYPEYMDIPNNVRWGSVVVMLPSKEKDVYGQAKPNYLTVIPRTREWGAFFGPLTYAMEQLFTKNPKEFGQFTSTMAPMLSPVAEIPSAQVFSELFEQEANWDFYRSQNIVPTWQKNLPAEQQTNQWVSPTIEKVANGLGTSPLRLNHAFNGIFGGAGGPPS